MVLVWIGGGLLLIALVVLAYYFNKIVLLNNIIENAWSQIDVQLKKRTDLVPNLVETVKGYAKHEKSIMKAVTEARKAMMGARTPQAKMKASNALTEALKSILALAENYPNLKANENFKLLQEQLEGIENKIAYSRQFYNDSVLDYNNVITTIPGLWFAALFGKTKKKPYFEIPEAERKVVKVKF
jgi:LemA protein